MWFLRIQKTTALGGKPDEQKKTPRVQLHVCFHKESGNNMRTRSWRTERRVAVGYTLEQYSLPTQSCNSLRDIKLQPPQEITQLNVGFSTTTTSVNLFFLFFPFHLDSTGTHHHRHPSSGGPFSPQLCYCKQRGREEGEKKQPQNINFIYGLVPLALLASGVNKPVYTDENPPSDTPKRGSAGCKRY